MGLFESIGSAISDVGRGINNAAIAIGNGAENIVQQAKKDVANLGHELSRGEVGGFIGNQLGAGWTMIEKGGQAVYDLGIKWDAKSAEESAKRSYGGAQDFFSGGATYASRSSKGQEILNDKNVRKYSGDLSKNYSGYAHGSGTLKESGDISKADLADTISGMLKVSTYGLVQGGNDLAASILKPLSGVVNNIINPTPVSHVNDPIGLTNSPQVVNDNYNQILLYSSIALVALYIAKQKRLI